MTYKIGQQLYAVDSLKGFKGAAKVVKIGRKWVTVENGAAAQFRFDKETGRLDGGAFESPGKVYADRAAYEYEKETVRLRRAISERCGFPQNRNITPEQLRQIAKILGLETNQ